MNKKICICMILITIFLCCINFTASAVDLSEYHTITQNLILHADGGNTDEMVPEVTVIMKSKIDGSIADIRQFATEVDGGFTYKFRFVGDIDKYDLIVRDSSGKPIAQKVEITSTDKITIFDLSLKLDNDGLYIADDEKAYAEAVINNTYGMTRPYVIVLAMYDENGKLISCNYSGNRQVRYEPNIYTDVFEMSVPKQTAKVKAFVMSDFTEIIPCTDAVEKSLTDYIELPNIISDNMLIQCDKPINIFGNASNVGQSIYASVNDGEMVLSENTSVVKNDGSFNISLPALQSGGPYTVEISSGKIEKTIYNVMLGELWLCSGQSNMEFQVRKMNEQHRNQVLPDSQINDMRIFITDNPADDGTLKNDVGGSWQVVTPATISEFSAVGWCALKEMHEQLNVPVGGIHAAHGGTAMYEWVGNDNKMGLKSGHYFNTMIHPFTQMNIRGILWYQGENSDDRNGLTYNTYDRFTDKFLNLIHSWENSWGYDQLPFMFVQLPVYGGDFSKARLGQTDTYQTLNYTGMAVSLDCVPNSATDIMGSVHPSNKEPVGKRLAYNALDVVYGKNIPCTGPLFKSIRYENNKAIITFNHVDAGLMTTDGQAPKYFSIAGSDGVYYHASAKIISTDEVEVYSENVSTPQYVRYFCENDDGFYDTDMGDNYPLVNLISSTGLPAGTFYSNPKVQPIR